jgi:hypothetical protein
MSIYIKFAYPVESPFSLLPITKADWGATQCMPWPEEFYFRTVQAYVTQGTTSTLTINPEGGIIICETCLFPNVAPESFYDLFLAQGLSLSCPPLGLPSLQTFPRLSPSLYYLECVNFYQ